ncbi:MAG: tetratricopeptide repeat protein [Candidatus Altiarchaeota archaeon]
MAGPSDELMSRLLAMSKLTGSEDAMLKLISDYEQRYPDDPMVHVLLGWSLTRLGRYDEAASCFERALELNPKSAWAYFRKGELLQVQSMYKEALLCYIKAVKLKMHNPDFWLSKALMEDELGRVEDALHSYEKSISLGEKSGWGWFWKSRILLFQERFEDSLEACLKAIEQNPEEEEFRQLKDIVTERLGE